MTKFSDERLQEMLKASQAVTPGPWLHSRSANRPVDGQSYEIGSPTRGVAGMMYGGDAAYVKLCDPDTIRSILTELQSLRQLDKEQEIGHIQHGVSRDAPRPVVVGVRGLEWTCPDVNGDMHARSILCVYTIRENMGSLGHWLTEVGGYHATREEAKAAAEADYRQRILSALETQEEDRDPNQCYCQECTLPIRDDLLVPDAVWEVIKPEGSAEGAGLLCPTCIMNRAGSLAGWTVGFVYPERHGPGVVAGKAETQEEEAGLRAGEMTPDRATYFLERFKREEKMLGPNEQWALDFAIAALAHPTPVQKEEEGQTVSGGMTAEQHRLESLKQMAKYDGPIVSFEFREPYYLASCDKCGWVGSSELCGTDSFGDDSDVYCPRCSASGADCGKVAETLTAALAKP